MSPVEAEALLAQSDLAEAGCPLVAEKSLRRNPGLWLGFGVWGLWLGVRVWGAGLGICRSKEHKA